MPKPKQNKAKPERLTAPQEKFAREYVRLGSGAAAYRLAYNVRKDTKPESIWTNASNLLADAKVARRVAELMAQAAEKAVISRASMLHEMGQNRELAINAEQYSVAQSASRDRAKVAGILVERQELTGKDGAALHVIEEVSVDERTQNDVARRIAYLLHKGMRAAKAKAPAE